MLFGTRSLSPVWCHPAPSMVSMACAPEATLALISAKCRFIMAAFANGNTRAAPMRYYVAPATTLPLSEASGLPTLRAWNSATLPIPSCPAFSASGKKIADTLEIAQGKVRQLIQDVDAVDATLKLFRPDMEIGIVRVRPTPRRHAAFRGESSRMILTMLRQAGAPMTTRDIVLKVMEARGLNGGGQPHARDHADAGLGLVTGDAEAGEPQQRRGQGR